MDRILNFHKATVKSEIGLKIISCHRHANCYEYLHKPSTISINIYQTLHLPNMVQWIGYFQQHTTMDPWWTSFFHEVFWDQLCAFHYSVVGCFVCWPKPQTVLCTISTLWFWALFSCCFPNILRVVIVPWEWFGQWICICTPRGLLKNSFWIIFLEQIFLNSKNRFKF